MQRLTFQHSIKRWECIRSCANNTWRDVQLPLLLQSFYSDFLKHLPEGAFSFIMKRNIISLSYAGITDLLRFSLEL